MNKRIRFILLFILTVILALLCGGCFDSREIDDQAFIIAIGLDRGKTIDLKVTLQLAIPKAIGGGSGGGGGGGESKITSMISIESTNIYSAFSLANNSISREINLSHAKALVISKELAEEGINKYLLGLARSREFRPDTAVIISGGEAEEFIKNIKPELESNPAKYYELLISSYKHTARTVNSRFHQFYADTRSYYSMPVAALGDVGKFDSSEKIETSDSDFEEKGRDAPLEGDFKAGGVPKSQGLKSEIMGMAVFNGDRMVGELDGEGATYQLIMTNQFRHGSFSIPDPNAKGCYIVLDIKKSRSPGIKVRIEEEKPVIDLDIRMEGDISSIQSGLNYESRKMTPVLENAVEEFFMTGIKRYLDITKKLKLDIAGFGMKARYRFLTWDKWESYKWLEKYKDAEFNVKVDFKVRRPGLMLKSTDAYSTD